MFRKISRKVIWTLLGSTMISSFVSVVLLLIGMKYFQDFTKNVKIDHHNHRQRRVGKVRVL